MVLKIININCSMDSNNILYIGISNATSILNVGDFINKQHTKYKIDKCNNCARYLVITFSSKTNC
ncbi:hypothetical protein DWZ88_12535 [Coprobacillus sp. AF36-10BH]|nr:hypothetical protein DWZ88_12535 [Coprobacillus sp. AF36-10BH]